VDPVLEISAIADRVAKMPAAGDGAPPPTDPVHGRLGGHALLFENVKGSAIPVAINVFAATRRMRLALGVSSFEEVASRVRQLIHPEVPTTLIEKMKELPQLARLASFAPGPSNGAYARTSCIQTMRVSWRCPSSSVGLMTVSPATGESRPMKRRARAGTSRSRGTHEGPGREHGQRGHCTASSYLTRSSRPFTGTCTMTGPATFRKYGSAASECPVAIVFGGESVLPYAATCPLPPDISELLFAGFLNEEGIEMVAGKTIPMDVPAHAEIVIEGGSIRSQTLLEGPFGDHTGFYSAATDTRRCT